MHTRNVQPRTPTRCEYKMLLETHMHCTRAPQGRSNVAQAAKPGYQDAFQKSVFHTSGATGGGQAEDTAGRAIGVWPPFSQGVALGYAVTPLPGLKSAYYSRT